MRPSRVCCVMYKDSGCYWANFNRLNREIRLFYFRDLCSDLELMKLSVL